MVKKIIKAIYHKALMTIDNKRINLKADRVTKKVKRYLKEIDKKNERNIELYDKSK